MTGALDETRLFDGRDVPDGRINRIALPWVSDAAGAVSRPTRHVNGTILCAEFKPDSGGTQPTNLYNVTLINTAGIDVLAGQGLSLSNASAKAVTPAVPFTDGTTSSICPRCVADVLTLTITGAGNAKGGQVILYVR